MNLPSYNTEQNNSNNTNNKKIIKWVIPTIAVIVIIVAAGWCYVAYYNNSDTPINENEYIPDYENDPEFNIGIGGAPQSPNAPMVVLVPGQHQEGERAAQAQAGAAAHPLVSCKAPSMCRPSDASPI